MTKEQITLPMEYEQSEEIRQLAAAEQAWLVAAQHDDDCAVIMSRYGDTSTYVLNARLSRRVAQTRRLQIEAGKPHCLICLGDHPDHLHTYLHGNAS